MSSPQKALEAFADPAQNPDLLRLESLLSRFNLFEAIGVLRQELRHSDLLACLLDPGQSHGLGEDFLEELLQSVLLTAERVGEVNPAELAAWDLRQVTVQREWHHIDILVLDKANRFAVIIENKIDSVQGPGQLKRYRDDFSSNFTGYKIIGLYLTPDGHEPEDDCYFAVSYSLICRVIDEVVENRRANLGNDVVILLQHYAQMLRRHIVGDTEVTNLCKSIYQQHKQALDLIFKHRFPPQEWIAHFIPTMIQQQPHLKFDPAYVGKNWINFTLREWENSHIFNVPYSQTSQKRQWLPYLQFKNDRNRLEVILGLALGNQADRQKLFDMAHLKEFPGCQTRLGNSWGTLYKKSILVPRDYDKTQEEIEAVISDEWAEFLSDDLPDITQAIRDEKWLWELPPAE